ncbi:APC family permease [Tumebacillus permanentifrigoris]|uniref:Amino acid/polyamine/organocation transporter (APC superfamily) n=1 Tax=Tumebacillus permanentifrigoris TaxID=378543 RepID=A0A316DF47_9BACL|nr:APC family permease [Tumebacillus permanentifrigoris]PWK14864.1 amino acid/polyamine/organocation transporter (APC superfamily) [Tumebacillus permanentifrigoris]
MIRELKRFLIGRPMRSSQLEHERLPKWKALPILSSDALSSVAYGSEAILGVLVAVSAAAMWYSLPISLAIVLLLTTLILSYRQIIYAYPNGGGAYVVSKDHLGNKFALVAGASLLVDYILTVAVSVTAGVAAITSAFPALLPHTVGLSVLMVLIIMVLNLRGITESATVFSYPTYAFILGLLVLIGAGLFSLKTGSVPVDVSRPHELVISGVTWFVLLQAFSSGCSALTGVEAISNATPAFRAPESRNAANTLGILGILLAVLFGGTSMLAYLFHIAPHPHVTVLSQVAEHVFGRGGLYFYIQGTTALILVLAANTSFTGFPLLAALMAKDGFVPRQFTMRGDRLGYSTGIIALSVAAILLIIAFNGDTDLLIPLYAIGVFLSFTLSQTGMVRRWFRLKERGWQGKALINGIGALVSLVVLVIFAVTKFEEGAWVVLLVLPILVIIFLKIRHHYDDIATELRIDIDAIHPEPCGNLVIIPISSISQVVNESLAYARSLTSPDNIICVYIGFDFDQIHAMEEKWERWNPGVRLVTMRSSYRSVLRPLFRFINSAEARVSENDFVTLLVPEFVTRKWWHRILHNQTSLLIKAWALHSKDIVVISVPYRLKH